MVTEYRVRLANEERQWVEAERLQTLHVDWDRSRAASALARPAEELKSAELNAIRALAVSLEMLGHVRRELGRVECGPAYEEALEIFERLGDRTGAAACAFNLGHAFKDLPALRDLDKAECQYRRSLGLFDKSDLLGRGRCLGQLGSVVWARIREDWTTGRTQEELLRQLNEAERLYHEALDLLPADAVNDFAVVHHQLGAIYSAAGDLDDAVEYHRRSIQGFEQAGDLFHAAQARYSVALTFFAIGRRADSLDYAEAALRGFEIYGERAGEMIERTRGLIAEIRGG